jgi:hypothetical protein
MTYNQTVSITGEYMKLDSTYTYGGITQKDYTWSRYSDTNDTDFYTVFENNKLTYKSYSVSEY